MAMNLKHKPVDASGRNWLLPFNDMLTLLLTFFVLMLSISKVDATKVQSASDSVMDAFSAAPQPGLASIRVFDPFVFSEGEQGLSPESQPEVKPWGSPEDRNRLIAELNRMSGVKARLVENGVEASFIEDLFFSPGQAVPAVVNHPGLEALVDAFRRSEAMIRIEDHTNDIPVESDRYSSCWELSVTRAARFAGILKDRGIAPRRLSISGNGDLRVLAPGRKGRGSLNRLNFILTFNQ